MDATVPDEARANTDEMAEMNAEQPEPLEMEIEENIEAHPSATLEEFDSIDETEDMAAADQPTVILDESMATHTKSKMFGRECARILRARYKCSTLLFSNQCWVPREISTAVQSILSKVVEHLAIGEAMEMTSSSEQLCSIANYLKMVYYKKASLLANSCKAIAILAGKDEEVTIMAFNYGRYLLMDDILDMAGISATSGNLSSDIASALEYLKKSGGMQRTREVATKYAGLALEAIEAFPRTNNKDAELSRRVLGELAQKII
ncbi:hypothetical protein POM88_049540 [Heracleum sosnowskyi]|uniref:Uncharacterized protein n=1 Tax=Heracleum sosnowskyi TaxID=360622 RepID=A0AAD8M1H6_9APIA|nr:hypothetical protein POM88_049540 [Heracleum sosnowskyi]